jgi:hypothetical protein
MKADIELVIDELVLQGFERTDSRPIGQAIQDELMRLLTEAEIPSPFTRSHEIRHLDAGSTVVTHGAASSVVGNQVAQAVYKGIGR